LAGLLTDAARRDQLGQNALGVVRENLGAVERTAEMIIKGIKDSGVYVAPSPLSSTTASEPRR